MVINRIRRQGKRRHRRKYDGRAEKVLFKNKDMSCYDKRFVVFLCWAVIQKCWRYNYTKTEKLERQEWLGWNSQLYLGCFLFNRKRVYGIWSIFVCYRILLYRVFHNWSDTLQNSVEKLWWMKLRQIRNINITITWQNIKQNSVLK